MRNGGKPPVPHIPLNLGKGLQRKKGTTKPGALARDKKIKKLEEKILKKTRAPTEKKKTTRAPSKPKIKESLIKQLEAKNANVAHFQDLIYDYLQLYDTKKMLQKDIKTRGVSYETLSASGVPIMKQNQSIKDLVAVEKQMLSILKEMGLTTDAPTGEDVMNDDL